jgi:hypothetical protein
LGGTTGRQLAIDYNRWNGSDAQFVGASEYPTVQHVAPDNFARRSSLPPYCVKDLFAQRASCAEHFHSAFVGHVLSNSTAAQDARSNLEAQVTYWLIRAGFFLGRLRRFESSLRMLRALIWPFAFAAMDDAGAAAFGGWPHVKSIGDVAATAIMTDHAWRQNLDSVDGCEPITLENTSPQRTLRSAPPENRRGASEGTVTKLRPLLGDALTNAAANVCFRG